MDQIYHLVEEIDAKVAAIEQAALTGEQMPTSVAIPGGLGQVTVDGFGNLVSVGLDRETVGTQTGESLARHILRTIQQAEVQAVARRDAMVAEAQGKADFE